MIKNKKHDLDEQTAHSYRHQQHSFMISLIFMEDKEFYNVQIGCKMK